MYLEGSFKVKKPLSAEVFSGFRGAGCVLIIFI